MIELRNLLLKVLKEITRVICFRQKTVFAVIGRRIFRTFQTSAMELFSKNS